MILLTKQGAEVAIKTYDSLQVYKQKDQLNHRQQRALIRYIKRAEKRKNEALTGLTECSEINRKLKKRLYWKTAKNAVLVVATSYLLIDKFFLH